MDLNVQPVLRFAMDGFWEFLLNFSHSISIFRINFCWHRKKTHKQMLKRCAAAVARYYSSVYDYNICILHRCLRFISILHYRTVVHNFFSPLYITLYHFDVKSNLTTCILTCFWYSLTLQNISFGNGFILLIKMSRKHISLIMS